MTAVQFKTLVLPLNDIQSTVVLNTTKALCWSRDNRIVVCCADKLIIVNLVAGSDAKTNKVEAFTVRTDETPNVSSLPPFSFSFINFAGSAAGLSEDERHMISSDLPLFEETAYTNPSQKSFEHAVCSHVCLALDRPHSLIAAVTIDHRVVIFTETSEGWSIMLDCSPIIKDHVISEMTVPVTLGKSMNLDTYIDLVHSMCTVELEWSSVFSSGDSQHPCMLLFTGSKNGTLTVWKLRLPYETKEDFTFQHRDKYKSQIRALSWHSKDKDQGLLAVGYENRCIRILSVAVNSELPGCCVDMKEMFSDLLSEGLEISDFTWAEVDKTTAVLICCADYYLLLYSVCGDTIKLVDHCRVDVLLPLKSIAAFDTCGFTASKDGELIQFQLKQEAGHISMDWSTVPIGCVLFGSELPRFCYGVAVSPHCGFGLSIHRLVHNARVFDLSKKYLSSQVIALTIPHKLTLESVMEALSRGSSHSPQEVMISLRLHIQQTVQLSSNLSDILEVYAELNKRDDLHSMQVVRDMLFFLDQCSESRFTFQKELEWVSAAHEKITAKLMTTHIEICLQNVSSSPSSGEVLIVKAMMNWLSARKITPDDSKLNLASLESFCQGSPDPLCVICGSEFSSTGFLSVKCTRGHQTQLCTLTLLPCQGIPGRKCEACAHPSVALSVLSDVKIITVKWLCVLCGGYLRDSIL